MESTVQQVLNNIANREGVKGVLVADDQGLCIAATGTATSSHAGSITAILMHAQELAHALKLGDAHQESIQPTIRIETDQGSIMIQNEDNCTLAIYK